MYQERGARAAGAGNGERRVRRPGDRSVEARDRPGHRDHRGSGPACRIQDRRPAPGRPGHHRSHLRLDRHVQGGPGAPLGGGTANERAEFIPLFRDLLERAFLGKIEQYGAENVAYVEESPDGDDTIVRTRVTLKPSWEVGVDYRMAWQGTRWMISDVLVERTSLVRNFRSQFDSVIKRSSYEELVEKVRARLP